MHAPALQQLVLAVIELRRDVIAGRHFAGVVCRHCLCVHVSVDLRACAFHFHPFILYSRCQSAQYIATIKAHTQKHTQTHPRPWRAPPWLLQHHSRHPFLINAITPRNTTTSTAARSGPVIGSGLACLQAGSGTCVLCREVSVCVCVYVCAYVLP